MKIKDTFEPYLQYLTDKGFAQKTVRSDRAFLYGPLYRSIGEREIDSLYLTDEVSVMAAGKAHGEYGPQRSIVTFRKLLKYLKLSGHPVRFDWRDIDIPVVPQKPNEYLTPDELELLFNSLDITTQGGLRTRALLEVLYATGMRIAEAISLNKADIDWEGKEVIITNSKSKDREKVYFTDRSLEWIKRYLESRKDDLPALFVSGRGRLLSVTSRNYLRTHLANLGINKHIKHHIFRKTFVTHLIQRGADISSVQDLARHRSPRTTLRHYAVINKERSKAVHRQILNDATELARINR